MSWLFLFGVCLIGTELSLYFVVGNYEGYLTGLGIGMILVSIFTPKPNPEYTTPQKDGKQV